MRRKLNLVLAGLSIAALIFVTGCSFGLSDILNIDTTTAEEESPGAEESTKKEGSTTKPSKTQSVDIEESIEESVEESVEESATTKAAKTKAPTTKAPTTEAATTKASATKTSTTQAPTTKTSTTKAPATQAPATTKAPSSTGTSVDERLKAINAVVRNAITKDTLAVADSVISQLGIANASAFDKVYAIHKYMIYNYCYDVNGNYNYKPSVMLSEHHGVCQAYAETFYIFMYELGIPCMNISGSATNSSGKTESHMWNAVKIDGYWYYVDVTWDDPIIQGTSNYLDGSNLSLEYFLVTNNSISANHTVDSGKTKTVPSPDSTSNALNDKAVARLRSEKADALTKTGVKAYAVTTYDEVILYSQGMGYGSITFICDTTTLDVTTIMNYIIEGFTTANPGAGYRISGDSYMISKTSTVKFTIGTY